MIDTKSSRCKSIVEAFFLFQAEEIYGSMQIWHALDKWYIRWFKVCLLLLKNLLAPFDSVNTKENVSLKRRRKEG